MLHLTGVPHNYSQQIYSSRSLQVFKPITPQAYHKKWGMAS